MDVQITQLKAHPLISRKVIISDDASGSRCDIIAQRVKPLVSRFKDPDTHELIRIQRVSGSETGFNLRIPKAKIYYDWQRFPRTKFNF